VNSEKIYSSIFFLNISKKIQNGYEDYVSWKNPELSGQKGFLDLIIIKNMQKMPGVFNHLHKGDLKICFYLENDILYTVCGSGEIQFQILEAIIEDVIIQFKLFYQQLKENYKLAFEGLLDGFKTQIVEIIKNIATKVKLVHCFCSACNTTISLYVKKSLIEANNVQFPVSIAYIHNGHASLVYLDRNFYVRGIEIINITE